MFSLDSSVGKWMAHQCHLANHCLSPSLTVSHNSLFLVCLPSHGKNNGFKTGWRRNNPRNKNPYINHHWQTQGPFFIIDLPSSLRRICSPTTCQNYCINVWQQIIFCQILLAWKGRFAFKPKQWQPNLLWLRGNLQWHGWLKRCPC